MAKPLYSVKFTSNFRFSKLSSQIDDILGKSNESVIDGLAQMTKRNITEGKLRGLSQNTLELRRRGLSTFNSYDSPGQGMNSLTPTSRTTPLHYTGNLLNSIKPTKDGIEMLEYGIEHHKGFKTPENRNVMPRKFIAGADDLKRDKEGLEKIQDDLVNKMNRAMMKRSQ